MRPRSSGRCLSADTFRRSQKWTGWHQDACNSTGLGKKRDETLTDQDEEADSLIRDAQAEEVRRKKDEAKKEKEASKMPAVVRDTVKATLPVSRLPRRARRPLTMAAAGL